jgi:hypothetical protein
MDIFIVFTTNRDILYCFTEIPLFYFQIDPKVAFPRRAHPKVSEK